MCIMLTLTLEPVEFIIFPFPLLRKACALLKLNYKHIYKINKNN